MPAETAAVVTAIVLVFALFGGVLAYVNHIAARRPDLHPAE